MLGILLKKQLQTPCACYQANTVQGKRTQSDYCRFGAGAEAGKQVTVLLELKARFDAENNIQWASKLERAGCHVIYGLTGLKTHCKITLVVRRDDDGIRHYLHLSTGNYNDVAARIYTDLGMFTCRSAFGDDASAFFNHLTGFTLSPNYHKFIVAPEYMKRFFLDRIDKEIENAKNSLPCGISIKINSLQKSLSPHNHHIVREY